MLTHFVLHGIFSLQRTAEHTHSPGGSKPKKPAAAGFEVHFCRGSFKGKVPLRPPPPLLEITLGQEARRGQAPSPGVQSLTNEQNNMGLFKFLQWCCSYLKLGGGSVGEAWFCTRVWGRIKTCPTCPGKATQLQLPHRRPPGRKGERNWAPGAPTAAASAPAGGAGEKPRAQQPQVAAGLALSPGSVEPRLSLFPAHAGLCGQPDPSTRRAGKMRRA